MIKIGIELNGVIRDINKQYLKYYVKDINPEYDEDTADLNVVNFIDNLTFESKKAKKQFVYEDYPYELFGCAAPMTRNLHTFLNGWIYDLYWNKGLDDVSVFSLGEEELTIQSTYFYLSKSGSRMRKVEFPREPKDVWDLYDVVITTNKDIVKSCPKNKVVILIVKNDNATYIDYADYSYNTLEEIIQDTDFCEKINKKNKISIFTRIKHFCKKWMKRN